MEANQLVDTLKRWGELHGAGRSLKVVVQVNRSQASIGGTPRVEISGAHAGIDWDSGVLFLTAEEELTALTAEELADVRKHVQLGQTRESYDLYQRCKALEHEVKTLKEQLDVPSTQSTAATDPGTDGTPGIPGQP